MSRSGEVSWSELNFASDAAPDAAARLPEGALHKLDLLKSQFNHFLSIILQYITAVVLNPYLAIFKNFQASASSLYQISIAHKELMKRICRNMALPCEIIRNKNFIYDSAVTDFIKNRQQTENLLKLCN